MRYNKINCSLDKVILHAYTNHIIHGDILSYHILVDDKAKILTCNKTLSFA